MDFSVCAVLQKYRPRRGKPAMILTQRPGCADLERDGCSAPGHWR
jgi:hypothetical protein